MRILFFGECASMCGAREMSIRIGRPMVLRKIMAGIPGLSPLLKRREAIRVAVNRRFSSFGAVVREGDEVALMSPFSGG